MDYDQTAIPSAYDAGRSYAPAVLELWLGKLDSVIRTKRIDNILDLGCGTGRYSTTLSDHFGAEVVAVDPSEKMLSEARRKQIARVRFLRGLGEAVPLRDHTVDMVFISMVFHHFDDPARVAWECRRVLREHGVVCLRGGSAEQVDAYPFVAFFPRARSLMTRDLASVAAIEATFAGAGLKCTHHEVVPSEVAGNWIAFAEKIAHRADSFLVKLTDAEFVEGLAALQEHARTSPSNEPVIEPVDFFAFHLS
jgi:ubiquinone/menaquinone biosynthesis C-methylase UbiE